MYICDFVFFSRPEFKKKCKKKRPPTKCTNETFDNANIQVIALDTFQRIL